MRPVELVEQESATHALDREELKELRDGFQRLDIERSCEKDSEYILNPGPWVGTIQLPTLTVRIKPKFPSARVLFLWFYAVKRRDWRDELAPFKDAPDLVEALAHAFASALHSALRRGVLHGYRLTEESGKTMRGRIPDARTVGQQLAAEERNCRRLRRPNVGLYRRREPAANIGRTIEICTLDISAEPRAILASVANIAARVRALAKDESQPVV